MLHWSSVVRLAAVTVLLAFLGSCRGAETPIGPGDTNVGFEVEFSNPEMSKQAELVAKARLRQAGARSYQVWRRESVVKARIVSIADTEVVRLLLNSEKGQGLPAALEAIAREAPYPEAPGAIRVVDPDAL